MNRTKTGTSPMGGGKALFRTASETCELSDHLAKLLGFPKGSEISLSDWLCPDEYKCMIKALSTAGCSSLGAASCEARVQNFLGNQLFAEFSMVCGEEEGTVFATILLYSGSENIVPQKILQEVFDVMPGSVAIYDSEDRLMFANPKFVDYFLENGLNSPFGSTFSELQMTCKNAGWYDRASPDPDSYLKLRLKAHEDCNGIFLQETPSGTFERIEEFRLPCGGRLTVYTDVTQHALESHDARERDQAKTDFLSVMSHEVRTPLVGLIGMLDMLEEADTRSERHRIETVMRKSGEQLMSIVDSFLDISKIDHGKLILEERPFSPVDTLANILDQYRLAAEAKGAGNGREDGRADL